MARRTRLLAVFALFVAAMLVVGSGAFSTVQADRTVDVDVADDDAALLELRPHSGANGAYASLNGGELEIGFGSVAADGVNQNATTTIGDVFNVTNQGTQTVSVYVTETGTYPGTVTFETADGTRIDGGSANAVPVAVGETIEVTIKIDTTGTNFAAGDALIDSITVHAET
jgi:hypothetical protein